MKKVFSGIWDYLKKSDILLLALCIVSTLYGVVLIRSCSPDSVRTQLLAMAIGIVLYIVISLIDIDILADNWWLLFLGGIGFILLLFTPLAYSEGANRAWLRFLGIGVQPAEVVKIFFIIILAKLIIYFDSERRLNHIFSVGAMSLVFLIYFAMIIVISSDLGSALVYLFIFAVLLFVGGVKLYWFLIALAGLTVAAPYIWTGFLRDDQKNRIIALFDPKSVDPTGLGITWQVNQSKAAIASGGIFGMGLGSGAMTQSGSVPRQRTDFIFSVAGEELGLVGCLLIVALLVAIIIRCVYVGMKCQNKLGSLIAIGAASMMAFQTFENISMCLGIGPVVGLTLPFFSSGGSSIVVSFALMGIISGIRMKPKPVMLSKY